MWSCQRYKSPLSEYFFLKIGRHFLLLVTLLRQMWTDHNRCPMWLNHIWMPKSCCCWSLSLQHLLTQPGLTFMLFCSFAFPSPHALLPPSPLQLIIDTPTSPVTSGLPLFFVITVTAIKQVGKYNSAKNLSYPPSLSLSQTHARFTSHCSVYTHSSPVKGRAIEYVCWCEKYDNECSPLLITVAEDLCLWEMPPLHHIPAWVMRYYRW